MSKYYSTGKTIKGINKAEWALNSFSVAIATSGVTMD
jgi:hypothetical protein